MTREEDERYRFNKTLLLLVEGVKEEAGEEFDRLFPEDQNATFKEKVSRNGARTTIILSRIKQALPFLEEHARGVVEASYERFPYDPNPPKRPEA